MRDKGYVDMYREYSRSYDMGYEDGEEDRARRQVGDILACVRARRAKPKSYRAYALGYVHGSHMPRRAANAEIRKLVGWIRRYGRKYGVSRDERGG